MMSRLTWASWITLSRIALTPWIVYFFLQGSLVVGLSLFLIAISTDVCDGFVARRFGQESRIGQILDPIADKILLSSVMYTLLSMMDPSGMAPSGMVKLCIWFLLVKEFVLLGGGGLLLWKYRLFIPPTILSRAASFCEVVLVVMLVGNKMMVWPMLDRMVYGVLIINVIVSALLLLRYGLYLIKQRLIKQ